MAAEDQFLNDPKTFLKHNLVIDANPSNQTGYKVAGLRKFKLEALDPNVQAAVRMKSRLFLKTTKDINCYMLKEDARGPIHAYWLPFGTDKVYTMNLGLIADIMFTPRMDGCSFGYKDNGDGTYTVTHLNFQKPSDGSIDDVASKVRMATLAEHAIHKKDYRTSILHKNPNNNIVKVTTVGFRVAPTAWEFHYQKYESSYDIGVHGGLIYHGLTKI